MGDRRHRGARCPEPDAVPVRQRGDPRFRHARTGTRAGGRGGHADGVCREQDDWHRIPGRLAWLLRVGDVPLPELPEPTQQ